MYWTKAREKLQAGQGETEILLGVSTANRQGPVIFGNTAPEGPDSNDWEEREKGLEQSTVDLSIGGLAKVDADHVLENLTNGEQQGRSGKIDC